MIREVPVFEHANLRLSTRDQTVEREIEVGPGKTGKREEVTQGGFTTQGVQGPKDLPS
jgi:hypothetical protein